MALSPIFRNFCNQLDHIHCNLFDDFPIDLHTDDFLKCPLPDWFRHPFCSHSCCPNASNRNQNREPPTSCCPRITIDKDGVEMSMNVKQFKPEEITVKTLDNTVQIEGRHKERNGKHGSVSRHFVRTYTLPRGYDPDQVMSTLSPDGILTVKAPAPEKIPEIYERIVPINHLALAGTAAQ